MYRINSPLGTAQRASIRKCCISRNARAAHTGAQARLRAALYRGGTSKAVIFETQHLPQSQDKWPPIFRAVIGSPDPNGRQLDGMGGGLSSVSKVCVVGPSERSDADVDYTFAAIGIKSDEVDFSSNCGNMISAIGPFAVDRGMVRGDVDSACVRIHNTNTGKLIEAKFPVDDGEASVEGDLAIDGVAGTSAKIELAFLQPGGSKTGEVLPTDNITDILDGIKATCIDVGNPCVFVSAADLGVPGHILADEIEAHPNLLSRLEKIRCVAAKVMGIKASGSIPKIAMISPPTAHTTRSGRTLDKHSCDVLVRAISVGQPHRAIPVTVAMAIAAAAKMEGSVVHDHVAAKTVDANGLTIGHNSGTMLVSAEMDDREGVDKAIVFRTARRLMDGIVYYREP